MTWIGYTVIDCDTMVKGKIVDYENGYQSIKTVLFDDGTEKVYFMNNVVYGRESEIASQKEYETLFFLADEGTKDERWIPFAQGLTDSKKHWNNQIKLQPDIKECAGYKAWLSEQND